jgi:hypothetical protein
MLYKGARGVSEKGVLAVRHNEQARVGGVEDASSELAEGRDTRGKALGSQQNTFENQVAHRPTFTHGALILILIQLPVNFRCLLAVIQQQN